MQPSLFAKLSRHEPYSTALLRAPLKACSKMTIQYDGPEIKDAAHKCHFASSSPGIGNAQARTAALHSSKRTVLQLALSYKKRLPMLRSISLDTLATRR